MLDRTADKRRHAAERQRRRTMRRKLDLKLFTIPADEFRLSEAMLASGRMSEADALDHRLVEHALTEVVADFIDRWTRHA